MDIFSGIVQTLTALAIVFAAWQLLFHSKQMHRDFELLYVQRYWQLMDRRSPAFALERDPTDADRLAIRAYLQLCEDEVDLRRLGRVTDNTWGFWSRSIISQAGEAAYSSELKLDGRERFAFVAQIDLERCVGGPSGAPVDLAQVSRAVMLQHRPSVSG